MKKISLLFAATAIVVGTACCVKTLKQKAAKSKNNYLGFDWNTVINHSADIPDFIKQLHRELKWARQRAFRGYDDTIYWDLDHYLTAQIIIGLELLIKNSYGAPVLEGWTEENCHENWKKELRKMLYYFKQSTDEYCKEVNQYDNSYHKNKTDELRELYFERESEIEEYKAKMRVKGIEMLNKYWDCLWD